MKPKGAFYFIVLTCPNFRDRLKTVFEFTTIHRVIQMEIEMKVNGIVNLITPCECAHVLVLQRKDCPFLATISIDCSSAEILDRIKEGSPTKRPRTHQLINNIANALGAKIEKVVLNDIKGNTCYALICIQTANGDRTTFDARPVDAVALALRIGCPIFADEEVLKKVDVLSKQERRSVLDGMPNDALIFLEPPTKYKM